jgi:hypothetical protein
MYYTGRPILYKPKPDIRPMLSKCMHPPPSFSSCVLFDVPVLVVASKQGIRTTVLEAAVVVGVMMW